MYFVLSAFISSPISLVAATKASAFSFRVVFLARNTVSRRRRHHHHHHHHISVMELGHLLTRSGLTYPEVSSKVYHDSFCQLDSSVSLPWVIYFEAFYLHVVFLARNKISTSNKLTVVYNYIIL